MPISRPQGFSLVEVLVVLAIVSIALLSVTLQPDTSSARHLDAEKKRLGLLVHALSERASILARSHKAVFGQSQVTFYEFSPSGWIQINHPPFEFRRFPPGVALLSAEEGIEINIDNFGTASPTELILRFDNLRVTLSIDALGRWR